ncbi:hypothetical protein [Wocania ichthyoenteri]|uniref:hypothetical protein n=1 Tax=Wocania ichthyoenteri TaxID=1230531 RepID=UPI00053E7B23|nr:hypothetical protein [Wocania ichthyoenteri]
MGAIFYVNNQYELEKTIWSCSKGDEIHILRGNYPVLISKPGIKFYFPKDFSVTIGCIPHPIQGIIKTATPKESPFFGLTAKGHFHPNFNIEFHNLKMDYDLIKTKIVYTITLPFPLNIPKDTVIVSQNGIIIQFKENLTDKSNSNIISHKSHKPPSIGINYPKAVIECSYLSSKPVDILKYRYELENSDTIIMTTPDLIVREKKDFETLTDIISVNKCHPKIKLDIIEYKVLLSINRFIKSYSKSINENIVDVLSITNFQETNLRTIISSNKRVTEYISYNLNKPTKKLNALEFLDMCSNNISDPDYPLSDYIETSLNRLEYHIATLGMYQLFEQLWNKQGSKYNFIQNFGLSLSAVKYIHEMINARNSIVHEGVCKTQNGSGNQKFRNILGAEEKEMTEYDIYIKQRPFYWFYNGILEMLSVK